MGYEPANIRNIALVGHTAAGKTTLGEALLLKAGVTNRLGDVNEGTSILDFDEESRERKHSLDTTLFSIEHDGLLLNFVDTPGMPDHCGPAIEALSAVETAVIAVSAVNGIGVNTRRMAKAAAEYGIARIVVINKFAVEGADLEGVYNAVRETFGSQCHAINLPRDKGHDVVNVYEAHEGDSDLGDVGEAHKALIESIVETDEALMAKYIESGEVTKDELRVALAKACAAGTFIPVVFCSSTKGIGIDQLLEALEKFAPSPVIGKKRELVLGSGDDATRKILEPDLKGDFVGQIFKVTTDPKSHIKYAAARVFSGTLKGDEQLYVSGERKGQRTGHIFKLQGGEHKEVDVAGAGDIVAFAKVEVHTGQTIFSESADGKIERPRKPKPMFSLAVEPKSRGDVEKISGAMQRFADEDPCFEYHRDPETHELVMSGMGDQHLAIIQSKMKRYFKLEIDTHQPKIPYRETISGSAKYVEYTHKKQSGGAGQFAKVFIDMEPTERGAGYEFEDKIFGGVIDQSYRPSVDKGAREQMKKGVIAGCPVVDVKISLVDGKTHPVDSKDVAFQIAGRQAFKKAFMQCKPILLEPVVNIEITVPNDNVGDITRDLAGKRGHVTGQDIVPGGQTVITGTVPLAEVANYSSQLKSVTGGQGSYVMEFSHYDVVPPNVQQQITAKYSAKDDDDE
ncbi:MAG: elongation factor G [Phycisphaerae bacterium]